MIIIFLVIGVIIGITSTLIFTRRNTIYGVVQVNHTDQLCGVLLNSEEVMDRKIRKAILKVNHID